MFYADLFYVAQIQIDPKKDVLFYYFSCFQFVDPIRKNDCILVVIRMFSERSTTFVPRMF